MAYHTWVYTTYYTVYLYTYRSFRYVEAFRKKKRRNFVTEEHTSFLAVYKEIIFHIYDFGNLLTSQGCDFNFVFHV